MRKRRSLDFEIHIIAPERFTTRESILLLIDPAENVEFYNFVEVRCKSLSAGFEIK